ncbi:helix-turn-helix transcriptional regulator [Breoghania sp.]|uniref:helix-turn-helix domain-containing protein n=1 Tax=Breoghania sp. TaxID=2065378 RepID=UPI002AAA75C6|nr:helix-turn-helix transcriptional regulator [Breoghania sp.]
MLLRNPPVSPALVFGSTPPEDTGNMGTSNLRDLGRSAEAGDDRASRVKIFAHSRTMRLSHNSRQAFFAQDTDGPDVRKTLIMRKLVADWLVKALDAAGMSQSALARELGLDPSVINKIVKNRRSMLAEEMLRAAAILNAPLPSALEAPMPDLTDMDITPNSEAFDSDLFLMAAEMTNQTLSSLPAGLTNWQNYRKLFLNTYMKLLEFKRNGNLPPSDAKSLPDFSNH